MCISLYNSIRIKNISKLICWRWACLLQNCNRIYLFPGFQGILYRPKLKNMLNDILALDGYFFFKLDELEYRNAFLTDCKEISKLFKEFILFHSLKYNNSSDLRDLEKLLFKYTHYVYGAMDAYM